MIELEGIVASWMPLTLFVCRSKSGRGDDSEGGSEDEWAAKLRMNAGFDDPYQDQSFAPGASSWERCHSTT